MTFTMPKGARFLKYNDYSAGRDDNDELLLRYG